MSNRLNDLAIADFLLFERNLDQATTSFADIQRLPPAHKAVWSNAVRRQRQYWTAPIDEPVFYKRADDYTDRFMELTKQAVNDRLRTQRVGILMSGGIDSSTIAAVACELSRQGSMNLDLRAFTILRRLGPMKDFTRVWSRSILGSRLNIGTAMKNPFTRIGRIFVFARRNRRITLECCRSIQRSGDHIGTHSRVVLQGEGPDNAFGVEWKHYVSYLFRQRRYGRVLRDTYSYLATHKRIPFWGKISAAFRKEEYQGPAGPSYPAWINKDLESRFSLRARWDNLNNPPLSKIHPYRSP